MEFQFKILSISDKEIIDKVSEAIKSVAMPLPGVKGTLIGGLDASTVNSFNEALSFGRAFQSIRFGEGEEFTITIDRADQSNPKSGFVDNVLVKGTTTPMLKFVELSAALRDTLPSVDAIEYVNALKEGDRQIYLARQKEINDLTGAQLRFFDDLRKFQYEQAKAYNQRESEQEKRHKQELAKLEEERRTNQESFEKQRMELEETKKALDLRDATAVRRDLREKLQRQVREYSAMSISPHLRWRRREVLGVYLGFLAILAILVGYVNFYVDKPATDTSLEWLWYLRQIGLTVTLIVGISFFLRWLNQWFVKLADEEFRLKRLGLDIDRGAWVFETAVSWREDKEHMPLPQYLIESLSKNLFVDGEPHDTELTAADSLASAILGSAANLKMNVPGGQVELNRKGLNRMGKTKIDDDE